MEIQGVPLASALFLLAVLVLLAGRRTRLEAESREGYRKILLGITALSLVSIAYLAEATGAISVAPFLSEPLFFQLTVAIVSITGVVLLAGGLVPWLPTSRIGRNQDHNRVARLELIRKIEQIVEVESRLTAMIETTLSYMVTQIDLPGGAVFVARRNSSDLRFLCARTNRDSFAGKPESLSLSAVTLQPEPGVEPEGQLQLEGDESHPRPDILVPVTVNGTIIAAFTLWSPENGLDDDDRMLLLLARDILARAIRTRLASEQAQFRKQADLLTRRVSTLLSGSSHLADTFGGVARLLSEELPIDLCALTVAYDSHDVRRYTVGEHGSLLTEKGLGSDAVCPGFEHAGDELRPVVTADFTRFIQQDLGLMLARENFTNAIVIPLHDGAAWQGNLLLATRDPLGFLARHLQVASALHLLLNASVSSETERGRTARQLQQATEIEQLVLRTAERNGDSAALFAEAATLLRRTTGAAIARIATFEENGSFLRSRALSAIHPVENAVPEHGTMIRTLMPLHQQVQVTGDLVVVEHDDSGPAMSSAEAQQIYQSDLASALLCPIKIGREVVGIISLADRRGSYRFRFTREDERFATSISAVLALAIRLHDSPWGALEYRDRTDADDRLQRSELGRSIRSSLSGILGSVEMLRTHSVDRDVDRYVGIIDRSARKIEAFFSEEEAVR